MMCSGWLSAGWALEIQTIPVNREDAAMRLSSVVDGHCTPFGIWRNHVIRTEVGHFGETHPSGVAHQIADTAMETGVQDVHSSDEPPQPGVKQQCSGNLADIR
jgi:hypothetical protein